MLDLDDLMRQARAQGLTLNGIRVCNFAGKGLGVVAKEALNAGETILSVPTKALRSENTVSKGFRDLLEGTTVQGLLAADLLVNGSAYCLAWKDSLPQKDALLNSLPFWWDEETQPLLPEAATKLVTTQKERLHSDWQVISMRLPEIAYQDYAYNWFLVGTRTFYFTHEETPEDADPYECIALVPFADYFNHAENGLSVAFSSEGYKFTTSKKLSKDEEIFVSYGNHNNDFLLAEYGFCLEVNQWDEVSLDPALGSLFNERHRKTLEEAQFWGHYTLDTSSVCYRTQVAVRLLCMPRKQWRKSLQVGFDEDDEYRHAVNNILLSTLESYAQNCRSTIDQLHYLDPQLRHEKQILTMRWNQILSLIDRNLQRLRNEEG